VATALGRTATRFFGSLFWRTFMLIALLLAISLGIWFQSYRLFERAPRAQQIAMQVVSVVKLTRAALLYSDPARRRFLLLDLVQNEGIKVYPREKDDDFAAPTANPFLTQLVQQEIRSRLGEDTVLATTVNDIPGVWVSFEIEGDDYWVAISPERF
jgi:two-component system, OmpR family, osmolarity sensor histidine kinase EnvZ